VIAWLLEFIFFLIMISSHSSLWRNPSSSSKALERSVLGDPQLLQRDEKDL